MRKHKVHFKRESGMLICGKFPRGLLTTKKISEITCQECKRRM